MTFAHTGRFKRPADLHRTGDCHVGAPLPWSVPARLAADISPRAGNLVGHSHRGLPRRSAQGRSEHQSEIAAHIRRSTRATSATGRDCDSHSRRTIATDLIGSRASRRRRAASAVSARCVWRRTSASARAPPAAVYRRQHVNRCWMFPLTLTPRPEHWLRPALVPSATCLSRLCDRAGPPRRLPACLRARFEPPASSSS